MANPVEGEWRTIAFSREELWVVHAALLDRVQTAAEGDDCSEEYAELDALAAIEGDRVRFGPAEVRAICRALDEYLRHAPPRDVRPGRTALRRAAVPEA